MIETNKKYSVTAGNVKFFSVIFDENKRYQFDHDEMISGFVIFDNLPDTGENHSRVTGNFEVTYPDLTIKGNFGFLSEDYISYDCVKDD